MTPKEKAKELIDKYFIVIDNSHPLEDVLKTAKQCALIAVDEILKSPTPKQEKYWKQVKQEIEKL